MNIAELSENLYEDLNGQITGVDYSNDLVIHFQCDDWNNHEVTRYFQITCHDVKESEVQPSSSGELELTDNHPLLWNSNKPHGRLYYSSAPNNSYEILGRMWEAHEKVFGDWRVLSDFANTYNAGQLIGFCTGSYGLLAEGPMSLLECYQKALSNYIKMNLLPSYTPEGGYKALLFDTCFVICKSVAVLEVSSRETE